MLKDGKSEKKNQQHERRFLNLQKWYFGFPELYLPLEFAVFNIWLHGVATFQHT